MSQRRFRTARRLIRALANRTLRSIGRLFSYEIVADTYYNGIPRFSELPPEFWSQRSHTPGLDLRETNALTYLREELSPFLDEYAPHASAAGSGQYYAPNRSFDGADAAVAWAMIRRHRPKRVLELGAGFSTLLIRDALVANGNNAHHIVVDPAPRAHELGAEDGFDLRRASAATLGPAEFQALGPGDILFVDTTHTVKIGSEVNHIVLNGFPQLAPGVLIHVHDVFTPYEYPRDVVEELHYHWAEQYLLQAFLAFNAQFEVLLPLHVLAREHEQELREIVPLGGEEVASMWLRRKPAPSAP